MRRIPGSHLPKEFLTLLETPGSSYASLSGTTKDSLRRSLLEAQSGCCAYCEREIVWSEDDPALKLSEVTVIEHFHPQSLPTASGDADCLNRIKFVPDATETNHSASLEPNNLLLSCDGNRADGRNGHRTCDNKKGNSHICAMLHNPKTVSIDIDFMGVVGADGKFVPLVYPYDGKSAASAVDEVLNLNEDRLVRIRRDLRSKYSEKAMEAIEKAPARQKRELLESITKQMFEDAKRVPFGSTMASLAVELMKK